MRGAHPEREIEREIERREILRRGERVLVACSGGPDSVALAAGVRGVAQRMQLAPFLAFVNHGGRTSVWQDECIVLELAARFELPLDVLAPRIRRRNEASLRDARYRALVETAKTRRCQVIATAHHAEDQSETVFLALLRGAGANGLRGMRSRLSLENGLDLARPFIGIPSDSLRAYCHAKALPYAVDPTNAQLGLRRNAVRDALDALRPLFPRLDSAVARAAALLTEEQDKTPRAQLRRSIRAQLAAEDTLRDIDFLHVEAVVRALEEGGTGTFHMKPGIALRIERGSISGIKRE